MTSTTHTHAHTPPDKGETTLGLLPQKERRNGAPGSQPAPPPGGKSHCAACVTMRPFRCLLTSGSSSSSSFSRVLSSSSVRAPRISSSSRSRYFSSSRLYDIVKELSVLTYWKEKNLRKILLGFILRASRCLSLTRRPGHVLWIVRIIITIMESWIKLD